MADAPRSAPLIAIVDDDLLVREAVADLMCSSGYEPVTFGSADGFLGSDRRAEVNCIVADIEMPGSSGLDLQARLAAERDATPIIFLTGLPPEDPRRRAAEASAACCLAKPLAPDALVRCIEDALAKPRQG